MQESAVPPCGTNQRYRLHLKLGEPTDELCKEAHRAYNLIHARRRYNRVRWIKCNYLEELHKVRLETLYQMVPLGRYGTYLRRQYDKARQRAESKLLKKYWEEMPEWLKDTL